MPTIHFDVTEKHFAEYTLEVDETTLESFNAMTQEEQTEWLDRNMMEAVFSDNSGEFDEIMEGTAKVIEIKR